MMDDERFHYYNLTVEREKWVKFIRTFPREVSIQKRLNQMIECEILQQERR